MSAGDTANRLAFVDALRSFAIVGVFLVHSHLDSLFIQGSIAQTLIQNGKLGVQLFMLVSGLTLMHAWHSRTANGHADTSLQFIVRRWFRIAPLYYLGILVYQVIAVQAAGLVLFPQGFEALGLNVLLLHSWWQPSQNTVVPGGWSIGVEFSFYLMFAFIVPWIKKPWHALLLLIVGAFLHGLFKHLYSGVFPLAISAMTPAAKDTFFYLWAPRQVPMFFAGMLVYFLIQRPRNRVLGCALMILGTLGMLAMIFGHFGMMDEVMVYALALSLVAIGLYHAPFRLLVNGVTQFIGRISYSFYIWHFLVLAVSYQGLQLWGQYAPLWLAWAIYVSGSFTLSVACAYASMRGIEQPAIALGRRFLAGSNLSVPFRKLT